MAGSVGPAGKCQRRSLRFILFRHNVVKETPVILRGLVYGFGIRGAAMFAEPTVTEVEEVVCLVHGKNRRQNSEDRIQESEV